MFLFNVFCCRSFSLVWYQDGHEKESLNLTFPKIEYCERAISTLSLFANVVPGTIVERMNM
jgi:hypothetical protein